MKFVELCGTRGPDLLGSSSVPNNVIMTTCQKNAGHETQDPLLDRWHRWFNDEGDLTVRWQGEGPVFNYDSGSWREGSK